MIEYYYVKHINKLIVIGSLENNATLNKYFEYMFTENPKHTA